jgi:hypothetical protein
MSCYRTTAPTAAGAVMGLTALMLCSITGTAQAGQVTLCPSAGQPGGINETVSSVSGPLDATCGPNSAVKFDLQHSTDYARLAFSAGPSGYPSGLTLGGLLGASANVAFTSGGSDNPYFMLVFTDGSGSLGQASNTDQILLLEFQPSTLSGNALTLDPNSTQFNLYDNSTDTYLGGGQHVTDSLAGWLTSFPVLSGESLDQIRVAIGLTGGDNGPESLTVNSLQVSSNVPEPATLTLFGAALAGLAVSRRRRR